jgi:tetratricopeptide (TPR) repeat protein
MMMRSVFIFILFAFMACSTRSQEMKQLQGIFMEAEYFLLLDEYIDALPYYLQLYQSLPENANIAYRIGLCYLNIPDKKNLALSYLETAAKNTSATYREGSVNQKSAPYDAIFHLGEAYRINYRFDEAKEAFIKFMETLLPDDIENLRFVDHQIKVCDFAKELVAKPVQFREENIGNLFNDERSNYNPVISADGRSFAYMVGLKFYNAIMFSRMTGNRWGPPVNITPDLQIDGTVFISGLSADGKRLYLSKNDNYESNIYSSDFDGEKWSPAAMLNRNINTRYWESHGFVTEDGNTLIFASDRPGGFGGLDLYISKKVDGDWGPAVNLGPEINTPFNEDRPFLINGGKTLFFCSQGHYNMGGYDIFRSDFQSNGLWSTPGNLGYPVNTPDDDTFFMPVENGKAGYIARFRGTSENFGKEDIYKITFR